MKSLKYSHSRNCIGLKKTIEKVRSESAITKAKPREPSPQPTPPAAPATTIRTNDSIIIPQPHKINPRAERMVILKERYINLVKNAFN